MLLFQVPPPTRYDVQFILAGIPVRVHPLFWLIAVLFGLTGNLVQLLIWVAAVFVSILAHEIGHALAFRRYGVSSSVLLYWGGGLTIPESLRWGYGTASVSLRPNQEILVSAAGPSAGFLLAGLVLAASAAAGGTVVVNFLLGILPLPAVSLPWGGWVMNSIAGTLVGVNFFWGFVNLLPVYPLDGGNITRQALLQADPMNGIRTSLWVSVVAGAAAALVSLVLLRSLFMTFLFGILAFQSYQSLRGRWNTPY